MSWIEEESGEKFYAFHQNHLDFVRGWLATQDAEHVVHEVSGYSMVALVGARIQESKQFAVLRREAGEQSLRKFFGVEPENLCDCDSRSATRQWLIKPAPQSII